MIDFSSSLAKRLFFGTLMTLVLAGLLLIEGYLSCHNYFLRFLPWQARGIGFAILAAFFVGAGIVELFRMVQAKGLQMSLGVTIIAAVLVVLQPFWANWYTGPYAGSLAGVLMIGLFAAALAQAFKGNQGALVNLALNCFAIIYLGLGTWFVLAIRLLGRNSPAITGQIAALAMFLACVKSADIGAYLIGRKLGRHKWVPSISPAKTWEGFFGGLLLAIIVASLFARFSDILSIGMAIVFGGVVATTGQLGDLLESMLKRDVGSKDSAHLVPEFGGVLDLLDSVLVAAPFAYLIFSRAGRFY